MSTKAKLRHTSLAEVSEVLKAPRNPQKKGSSGSKGRFGGRVQFLSKGKTHTFRGSMANQCGGSPNRGSWVRSAQLEVSKERRSQIARGFTSPKGDSAKNPMFIWLMMFFVERVPTLSCRRAAGVNQFDSNSKTTHQRLLGFQRRPARTGIL